MVNRADAVLPSPSQTPRAYGGSGRSDSGRTAGFATWTAWLRRASAVSHLSVAAISSVVFTEGNVRWFRLDPAAVASADFLAARVSVSHWWAASATMTVPSLNSTS